MDKIPLDELEVMMQLVKIDNPKLKFATYNKLKEEIDRQFMVNCNVDDISLLHEPTIEQMQLDAELMYCNLLNYSPILNEE